MLVAGQICLILTWVLFFSLLSGEGTGAWATPVESSNPWGEKISSSPRPARHVFNDISPWRTLQLPKPKPILLLTPGFRCSIVHTVMRQILPSVRSQQASWAADLNNWSLSCRGRTVQTFEEKCPRFILSPDPEGTPFGEEPGGRPFQSITIYIFCLR